MELLLAALNVMQCREPVQDDSKLQLLGWCYREKEQKNYEK